MGLYWRSVRVEEKTAAGTVQEGVRLRTMGVNGRLITGGGYASRADRTNRAPPPIAW